MTASRYEGDRFLRLLELYVLWAIGALSARDSEILEQLTPKLQDTFACSGTWQDCVSLAMEFPAEMPELIRERWHHNQALARANGEELQANDFAVMFVDANCR